VRTVLSGTIAAACSLRAALVLVAAAGLAIRAFGGDAAAGKAVFDGARPACASCHRDTLNPLAGTGAQNTEDELRQWVRNPSDMIEKKSKKGRMPAYGPEKISDPDLDNLVAYLATLQ
jgi:mono/diheme cytochrome c family protein